MHRSNNKIFKFKTDTRIYGQGIHEPFVRSCIETRLGLEQGTLAKGTHYLKSSELKKVTNSSVDLSFLFRKLSIDLVHLKNENNTLKDLYDLSSSKIKLSTKKFIICDELNISRDVLEGLDESILLSDLLYHSSDKIILRTSKYIRKPVLKEVFDGISYKYNMKYEITDVKSRIDIAREQITRLLEQDYTLLIEQDFDEKIMVEETNLYRGLNNLKRYKNIRPEKYSKKEYDKLMEKRAECIKIKEESPKIIEELKEKRKESLKVYHNTGYYVKTGNDINDYEHKNYEEVMEGFNKFYEKIRNQIVKHHMSNVVYPGDNFTLLELIDSYWLIHRGNNNYARSNTAFDEKLRNND